MKFQPDERVFRILYHKKQEMLGIKNLSPLTWTVIYSDNKRQKIAPGRIVQLKQGERIAVIPRVLQINVVDAR